MIAAYALIVALASVALASPAPLPTHQLLFHSHNDYLRHTPVFDAFDHGIRSFESDLWFDKHSHALHVAHTALDIQDNKTFKSVTVDRVLAILNGHHNGSLLATPTNLSTLPSTTQPTNRTGTATTAMDLVACARYRSSSR